MRSVGRILIGMLGSLGRDFSAWLDRVPITDPYERRQARSLQIFSLVVAVELLVTEIARAIRPHPSMPPEVILTAALTIFALVMVRRGAWRIAGGAYLFGIWAIACYDLISGGLDANRFNVRYFALLIVAAGLLLGRRIMWATVAGFAITIAIAGLRDIGYFGGAGPQAAPSPPLGSAGHAIVLLAILAIIVDRFGLTLRTALADAVARQRDAERAWADLSAAHIALEREMQRRADAEAQLVQAQRMEAVGQLAGGIAHDFNNALTAVIAFNELASQSIDDNHRAAKDLRQAIGAAEHAGRLTQDLLTFARKRPVHPAVLYVEERVDALLPMLRGLLGAQTTLETDFAGAGWAVQIDPGQLEQIFINLAVNAHHALPDGGHVTIATRHRRVAANESPDWGAVGLAPGDWIEITVRDTGHGMDAETLQRAFEPFFTTKSVGNGTGLGLAICYGVITQAGGHIRLSSEPGAGTTCAMYLPRVSSPAEAFSREPPTTPPPGGTEALLLVDDDPAVRHSTARLLRELGYTVVEATSGLDAIGILRMHEGPLALVITDVVMPHVAGGTLAEWLREHRPGMRVMFITAHSGEIVDRETILRHNALVVTKPFTPGTLARAVRFVLDAEGRPGS
jgi:signal transduction histidine kinase/CheY-like chemotaxis protein